MNGKYGFIDKTGKIVIEPKFDAVSEFSEDLAAVRTENNLCGFIDKNGNVLGKHKGYPFYTIGQRKGLDIAVGRPLFVTKIDPGTNTVVLGDEEDLEQNEMLVGKLNLIKYDTITPGMEATTKIRYKDKGALSNIYPENGNMKVKFYEHVKGIAPGQSAVFYEGEDVIGGGLIQRYNPAF